MNTIVSSYKNEMIVPVIARLEEGSWRWSRYDRQARYLVFEFQGQSNSERRFLVMRTIFYVHFLDYGTNARVLVGSPTDLQLREPLPRFVPTHEKVAIVFQNDIFDYCVICDSVTLYCVPKPD